MRVMFDTNVFSNLANGRIDPARIPPDWQPVATHLQWREIQRTKDPETKAKIEAIFQEHLPEELAPILILDVSALDHSVWAKPGNIYHSVLNAMNIAKEHRNNPVDAAIAEACERNGIALATNDGNLAAAARAHGISVFNLERV